MNGVILLMLGLAWLFPLKSDFGYCLDKVKFAGNVVADPKLVALIRGTRLRGGGNLLNDFVSFCVNKGLCVLLG